MGIVRYSKSKNPSVRVAIRDSGRRIYKGDKRGAGREITSPQGVCTVVSLRACSAETG